MKKLMLTTAMAVGILTTHAQQSIADYLKTYIGQNPLQSDSLRREAIKQIFSTPDLYNDALSYYLGTLQQSSPKAYTLLKDVNLKFKTFQAQDKPVALGFSYKYNNAWVKNKISDKHSFMQSYNLGTEGNVAFKKIYNPNDFLETSFSYDGAFIWGGKVKELDEETSKKVEDLEDQILKLRQAKNPAFLQLYERVNSLVSVTDQYYLGFKLKLAYETNQDFSKRQFTPGGFIAFGAKGWNKQEALRYLNILDYPFALIRVLTGTDKDLSISGASFPSFLIGIDHVIPGNDTSRFKITNNEDPYQRFRFEVGFKTLVAKLGKDIIYFSANYRLYNELNASENIKSAGLDKASFIAASLQSSTGLFVSFTDGRLPFDRIKDQVYAIGFQYNLGDWKK
jgi:hypothetical protein